VPDILVAGGGNGALEGLAATAMRYLGDGGPAKKIDGDKPDKPTGPARAKPDTD
jgi:hypothetical protein